VLWMVGEVAPGGSDLVGPLAMNEGNDEIAQCHPLDFFDSIGYNHL